MYNFEEIKYFLNSTTLLSIEREMLEKHSKFSLPIHFKIKYYKLYFLSIYKSIFYLLFYNFKK